MFYNAYVNPHFCVLQYCVVCGATRQAVTLTKSHACKLTLSQDYTDIQGALKRLNILSFDQNMFLNKAKLMYKVYNQRTNGPVNAHLISWHSKAQHIHNLENIW